MLQYSLEIRSKKHKGNHKRKRCILYKKHTIHFFIDELNWRLKRYTLGCKT